jgi:hypothetical protein
VIQICGRRKLIYQSVIRGSDKFFFDPATQKRAEKWVFGTICMLFLISFCMEWSDSGKKKPEIFLSEALMTL